MSLYSVGLRMLRCSDCPKTVKLAILATEYIFIINNFLNPVYKKTYGNILSKTSYIVNPS